MRPEQQSAVWAVGQTDSGFEINRLNVQSCQVTDSFTFDERITSLLYSNDALWLTSGGSVYRYGEGDEAPAEINLPSELFVVDMLVNEQYLWLVTDSNQLIAYSLENEAITVEIGQDANVNSLISNGRQVWAAREDNSISRYILPDYVYPDLVDMVWLDDALWVIDTNNDLCSIREERLRCNTLELDAEAITLTADHESLWLGLADNRVLQINPENSDILQNIAVPGITAPNAIVPVNGELWVSDLFTATVVIDLTSGTQTTLDSLNVQPPAAIAYDDATVWFADTFTGTLFTVTREDDQLRQGRAFDLPASGETVLLLADGDRLTVFTSGSAYVLSPTGGALQQVVGIGGTVDDVALAPDGVWIADRDTGFIYFTEAAEKGSN